MPHNPSLTVFSCKWKNSHLVWTQSLTFLLHANKNKRIAKKKSSKNVGTLTIETAAKRPDLAYLSPEMVMPYINS
jgi:hypothetical protein